MKDMVDLIKLSILLILFSVCEGVKTYRNVLDVSTPAPMVGGLSLVEAATNVTVQDLTICIRLVYSC